MRRKRPDRPWAVVLHNDDVNSHQGVVYVLNRTLGMAPEVGLAVAREVHGRGEVVLVTNPDRQDAERLVVTLQLYGLHCTARVRK